MIRRFRGTLLLALPLLLAAAVAAAPPTASGLKAQAVKLAAAGKHLAAAERISEARGALRRERRAATGNATKPHIDPRYRAEVQKLAVRYRKQWEKGPRTQQRRKSIYDAFTREKAAIDRKYGMAPSGSRASAGAAAQLKVAAQFDLRDAEMEELQALYMERLGQRKQAADLRQHAMVQRTQALAALGRKKEAEAAGTRLLQTNPRSPQAYRAVAELYQSQGKYGEAAQAWEQGIRALTGTRSMKSKQRTEALALFYRQLAFSYQKAGKGNESRQALARAQELERGGR
jgi:tetratricopeptide (TPR) repeat protein